MKQKIVSLCENRSMNFLLQTVLSDQYRFCSVPNAMKALQELKQTPVTGLLVVDVDYAAEENWNFINHIQTSSFFQVPVVVLLSQWNQAMMEKLVKARINDYFLKPFNPLEFLKTVKELTQSVTTPINAAY